MVDGEGAGEARASKSMVLKSGCVDIVFLTMGPCWRDLIKPETWSGHLGYHQLAVKP